MVPMILRPAEQFVNPGRTGRSQRKLVHTGGSLHRGVRASKVVDVEASIQESPRCSSRLAIRPPKLDFRRPACSSTWLRLAGHRWCRMR